MKDYNEKKALTNYIIFYYSNLLDDFDRKILNYRLIRRKRLNGDYDGLLKKYNIEKEEEIELIPFIYEDAFFQYFEPKVEALLKNTGTKILINRCPKCNKIARTSKAKQCRYCDFEWH